MRLDKFVLLSLLFSSSVFSNNCPFDGVYGGLDIGLTQSALKDNYRTLIQVPTALDLILTAIPTRVSDVSLTGGLALGYSMVCSGSYLVGLEARANFEDLKTMVDHQHIEANSALIAETTTTAKLDKDFALLAKLGYVFNPNVLLYGLIGADWGDFDITSKAIYTQNIGVQLDAGVQDSHGYYDTAWVLGLGFEYLFTECASISLEYTYANYGNLKFPATISGLISLDGVPTAGTLFSDNNQLKMYVNSAVLRFNYYFG